MVRLIRSQLYNVTTTDPVSIGTAVALVVTIGAMAGLQPPRCAARLDPMRALRYE